MAARMPLTLMVPRSRGQTVADRLAVPPVSPLVSGSMTERAPIHLGSGEPILLLHPFMMSQNVWKGVAPLIAETGRYEVFAPTMPGHNGGAKDRFS